MRYDHETGRHSAGRFLLAQGDFWERKMRLHTTRPDLLADAIRQAVGREASRVRSYRTENGETVHIMQVVISRLEAVPLTELIVAADPQAIVDVVPLPGSFGLRRSIRLAKRHPRRDLPDVTKYGNELNED